MKVALVSLDQIWEDKGANIARCEDVLNFIRNVTQGIDLVVFPEMTLTGFSVKKPELAECFEASETVKTFTKLAVDNVLAVMFGVIFKNSDCCSNSLCCINKHGNLISRYDKVHPFSFGHEDQNFMAGDQLVYSDIDKARIGNTICYDLRFPELYSAYASSANIIVNVANWPESRLDHWYTLLQARSIETMTYVVGVNRTGTDGNGLIYSKSTVVYQPNGKIILPESSNDLVDFYEIDLSLVQTVRSGLSVFKDRKVNFYKEIL